MAVRLAPRLDGNNGTLSQTLGLGDPINSVSLLAGEARLILGHQLKEPSLYVAAVAAAPAFVEGPYNPQVPETPGGGDGGDSGGGDSPGAPDNGSGNDGSDGDGSP